jgi:hypothetical protein
MSSNHGDGDGPLDPKFMEALGRSPGFGATGKYPDGKLSPDDEGELQFGITNSNGQVIINFGKPVAWLAFGPQQARELADAIIKHADQARVIGGNRAERRATAAKQRSKVD